MKPLSLLTLCRTAFLAATVLTPTCALAQAGATATAAAPTSVPVYRGNDERTGFIDTPVRLPVSVAWQNTTSPGAPEAGDQSSGQPGSQPPQGDQRVDSSPVSDNGVLFFGAGTSVYAISASTGATQWIYPTAAETADPDIAHPGPFRSAAAVADGMVFIGNDDGNLYVIDETTGKELWTVRTGGAIRTAPVIHDGIVFFGSMDGNLYDIRISDHQPAWGGAFRVHGPLTAPPLVSGDAVYFVNTDDTLYKAALSNGRLIWSERFQTGLSDSPPLMASGTLIACTGGSIYGIDTLGGATRWVVKLPADATAQLALGADGNTLYAVTQGNDVVAITTQGRVLWTTPIDSVTDAAPVATPNYIVAVSRTGIVYALDPTNGAIRWLYSLTGIAPPKAEDLGSAGDVSATPLVADGVIYTLDNHGTLTAFSHRAVDDLPPTATLVYPPQDKAVAGAEVPYQIAVKDVGSGIDPATMSLTVNTTKLPIVYIPGINQVQIRQSSEGLVFGEKPVPLATLTNGQHSLTLSATDWRGNLLLQTWHFSVDSSLNPPGSPLPPAQPSADQSSPSPATDQSAGAPGGAEPAGAGNGGAGNGVYTFGGGAATGPGGSGAGSGSSGSGGGSPGSAPSPPQSGGGARPPSGSIPVYPSPPVTTPPPSNAPPGMPPPPPI